MSNKNFAGQKLDGRSFRGQDLRGADFSGCSLKSCDFRGADLAGANFYKAEFGLSDRWVALKFLIGFLLCFYVMFGSFALSALYLGLSGDWFRGVGYRFPYVGLVIFSGQMLFLWLSFKLK